MYIIYLRWVCRRSGKACLSGVMWTECMLELLRRPPLSGSVHLNGAEAVEGRDTEARVGDTLEVEVRLENRLLEPVQDCRVLVRLEQEHTGILLRQRFKKLDYTPYGFKELRLDFISKKIRLIN